MLVNTQTPVLVLDATNDNIITDYADYISLYMASLTPISGSLKVYFIVPSGSDTSNITTVMSSYPSAAVTFLNYVASTDTTLDNTLKAQAVAIECQSQGYLSNSEYYVQVGVATEEAEIIFNKILSSLEDPNTGQKLLFITTLLQADIVE